MIRLVIAVVIGVAVLAAALPVVETTRTDRADARLARFTDRLAAATERVTSETPARVGLGPRQVVGVRLPKASLDLAPVRTARVRCGDRGFAVAYRLAGESRERSIAVPVPAAIRAETGEREAVVAAADRLRVHVGFRLVDDRPTVVVGSAGGSSGIPEPVVPCSTRSAPPTRPPAGAGPI